MYLLTESEIVSGIILCIGAFMAIPLAVVWLALNMPEGEN